LKRILYYVTDHGRGHATRSIAIIRDLLKEDFEIIIRNSNVLDFIKKSLPEINIIPGITDVGPIMKKDGISIDSEETKKNVGNWLEQINKASKLECDKISKYSPDLIISDISAMPFLVAENLSKPSIAISNFSWYDVLDNILSNTQLSILKEAYDVADLLIQLPLGTPMEHFKTKKKVGYVCRYTTDEKMRVRKKIGLKESELGVFVALGQSKDEISVNCDDDIKIITTETKIKNQTNLITLPGWIEGQDLVAASDLVICKCGYGIISECMTNGTPFQCILDDNHKEQKFMYQYLVQKGLKNRITIEEVNNAFLDSNYISKISKSNKEKIDNDSVVKYIREILIQ
jgi:predicted glycosyltransferase